MAAALSGGERLDLAGPAQPGGVSRSRLLKVNQKKVPSPTGPWIVAILPIIATRLPYLLLMEVASQESLQSLAEDGLKAAEQARRRGKVGPAWTAQLPLPVGVMQFRMMYRNVKGTRALSKAQEERLKAGRAADDSFQLQEPPSGCLVNENQGGMTRLVRLILKEFGSNRMFADWHSIRRQLTPDYWTNLGRGGNAHDDHSQTFIEIQLGCYAAHQRELERTFPDCHERVDRAMQIWQSEYPYLTAEPHAAAAAALGGGGGMQKVAAVPAASAAAVMMAAHDGVVAVPEAAAGARANAAAGGSRRVPPTDRSSGGLMPPPPIPAPPIPTTAGGGGGGEGGAARYEREEGAAMRLSDQVRAIGDEGNDWDARVSRGSRSYDQADDYLELAPAVPAVPAVVGGMTGMGAPSSPTSEIRLSFSDMRVSGGGGGGSSSSSAPQPPPPMMGSEGGEGGPDSAVVGNLVASNVVIHHGDEDHHDGGEGGGGREHHHHHSAVVVPGPVFAEVATGSIGGDDDEPPHFDGVPLMGGQGGHGGGAVGVGMQRGSIDSVGDGIIQVDMPPSVLPLTVGRASGRSSGRSSLEEFSRSFSGSASFRDSDFDAADELETMRVSNGSTG